MIDIEGLKAEFFKNRVQMYEYQGREKPLISTIYTLLFPGYRFWKSDQKIAALSITVACYLGYLIGIGFLITIFMLYSNWKQTNQDNQKYGHKLLTEEEEKMVTYSGMLGGIFGHPFYLLFGFYWIISQNSGSKETIKVNPILYSALLVIIFALRAMLFINIKKVRTKQKDLDLKIEFLRFSRQHGSLILMTPLFSIFLLPLPKMIALVYMPILCVILSLIFGSRVIYNELKIMRT